MTQFEKDINISAEEVHKIKKIYDALISLEMAAQYGYQENTDLALSEKVIVFATKKLIDLDILFGNVLLKKFKKRIQE